MKMLENEDILSKFKIQSSKRRYPKKCPFQTIEDVSILLYITYYLPLGVLSIEGTSSQS
jgi:hypothetical protein